MALEGCQSELLGEPHYECQLLHQQMGSFVECHHFLLKQMAKDDSAYLAETKDLDQVNDLEFRIHKVQIHSH